MWVGVTGVAGVAGIAVLRVRISLHLIQLYHGHFQLLRTPFQIPRDRYGTAVAIRFALNWTAKVSLEMNILTDFWPLLRILSSAPHHH